MTTDSKRTLLVGLVVGTVMACSPRYRVAEADVMLHEPNAAAAAVMRSSTGERLGMLRLYPTADGRLRVAGTLTGLSAGAHGVHLHAVGQCVGPTFESAGAHFNPEGRAHGLENANGPHAGDAPNITADMSGRADVNILLAGASLNAGSRGYINDSDGVAIVVHASADDQRTDPSGNSGARIACGVVGAS